ncbi:MAG: TraR/DksA C4-type zinc finger protein [Syntrophomonadaceae bacterium]|jgi:DnaK suppressor protein
MDPKQKLINKKQELEHIIKSRQENFMIPLHELTGDLSTYDQHPADSGSELYEREKDLAVMELYELELEKVHDALNRYDEGNYGTCEICGGQIEPQRLNRLINTTRCANCAQKLQSGINNITGNESLTMIYSGEEPEVAGYQFDDN